MADHDSRTRLGGPSASSTRPRDSNVHRRVGHRTETSPIHVLESWSAI